MSKVVGKTIPDTLVGELDGARLESKIGSVYVLVTADEDGTPRPCMLSAGEVIAPDASRLRFALWRSSRTGANLARRGRALFCHVAPGVVLYIRGAVRALAAGEEAEVECFELTVDSVESDAHAGMPVTSGITFAIERGDPAAVLEAWERQLATLRAAR